jgi:Flp pilus assembly protein TadD
LTEHPDHPEAPLVAITLARATAERDPAAAVEHLRLARRLGVPRLLDAEVCSTLARALERTGELEAARSEARACLGRHGTPLHHEELRRLAGDSRQ